MDRHTHTYVSSSSLETINGMHKVTLTSIDYIYVSMGYSYDIYVYGEPEYYNGIRTMEVPISVSSQVLSHPYYPTEYHDVSDLTGINYFTNVRRLNCNNQQLKGTLDLRALTKLDSLACNNNRLTDLKVNLHSYPFTKVLHQADVPISKRGIAHQRVFLDCSNNYLSDLNDVNVIPTAKGQLVNFEGSCANNRILAHSLGNHPYYDRGYSVFASDDSYHGIRLHRNSLTNDQKVMFQRLATPDTQTTGDYIRLFFWGNHDFAYNYESYRRFNIDIDYVYEDGYYLQVERNIVSIEGTPNMFWDGSSQNIGVNLSMIDKTRRRVGVKVADNLYDEPDRFRTVQLLNVRTKYPEKVKSGENTYYEFPVSDSAHDLDYCHTTPSQIKYSLFNGYEGSIGTEYPGSGHYEHPIFYSAPWLTKYADIFDPNANPRYVNDTYDSELLDSDIAYADAWADMKVKCWATQHNVTLTADHYVMYVNPLSEDKDGKCNGTVILDYDATTVSRPAV